MKFFNSFFIAGYECADHLNAKGERIHLLEETEHDLRVVEDYELIQKIGIHTVREGICWSNVEKTPYHYDFDEVRHRIEKANLMGIQQIWDIMHFGCPDDIYPTHPHFEQRFVALCKAFVEFYNIHSQTPLIVVPINEISFHSWFAGESKGTAPYVKFAGWEIKYALCKAAISGIKMIKSLCPEALISMVEPMVYIHADEDSCLEDIQQQNDYQFQAIEMITGRICPELGGEQELIDLIGINYYWNCQWKPKGGTLLWPEVHKERIPIDEMIVHMDQKYSKPIWISETGHIGIGRAEWLNEMTEAVIACSKKGVTIHGLCLYPVIDRPNWDDLNDYHNCGIWDLDEQKNRIPFAELIQEIQKSNVKLNLVFANEKTKKVYSDIEINQSF
jgi:beta-glucosidase/6-phospho-beta-glucosidase/beta-galactosidase